jgi:hypothetical protein
MSTGAGETVFEKRSALAGPVVKNLVSDFGVPLFDFPANLGSPEEPPVAFLGALLQSLP